MNHPEKGWELSFYRDDPEQRMSLLAVILERVAEKQPAADPDDLWRLANNVTNTCMMLENAVDTGFVDSIDAYFERDDYSFRARL